MTSNNLFAFVPLDPLCSRIPINDYSFGIEHINCIITDTFHQNLEPSLSGSQGLLTFD